MSAQHPFDAELLSIDPQAHRVTSEDLANIGDDGLKITALLVSDPLTVIDLTVYAKGATLRLVCPRPVFFMFAGSDIHPDGSVEPYVLSAAPCHCPHTQHDQPRWNPLIFAMIWYPGLHATADQIFRAYATNLLTTPDSYCEWGMALIGITK